MKFFVAFLGTIALLVLVLFLILNNNSGSSPTDHTVNLTDYLSNTSTRAQLYVTGPVVAQATRQEVEIDVTSSQVAITIYSGYLRTIQTTQSYANNVVAYNNFLFALQRAGFTKGNTDKTLRENRGLCVAGNTYNYSFNDGTRDLTRFWSTSCGQHTFGGNINTAVWLFKNQVPNLNAVTQNLSFGF